MHATVSLFRLSELDDDNRPRRVHIDLATGKRDPLRR
jgi:hypothetical protein